MKKKSGLSQDLINKREGKQVKNVKVINKYDVGIGRDGNAEKISAEKIAKYDKYGRDSYSQKNLTTTQIDMIKKDNYRKANPIPSKVSKTKITTVATPKNKKVTMVKRSTKTPLVKKSGKAYKKK